MLCTMTCFADTGEGCVWVTDDVTESASNATQTPQGSHKDSKNLQGRIIFKEAPDGALLIYLELI